MTAIDYSVVIRTTGNANEKYRALLDSVKRLQPQPAEIIVVLPENTPVPKESIGSERFCYCERGMVRQRMEGLKECKTEYALFCDDDISFESDFVERLYQPLAEGIASFSAGPLYSFLPQKGLNSAICILMASASPTVFHKNERYISILKSSGYSYNRSLEEGRYYLTQSLPWTCFFASTKAFRDLGIEKEDWLDAHGYSALDDQTMFYKAWLMGYKTVIVPEAVYEHLDARTSTKNNNTAAFYSRMFNRVVFWDRFIYSQEKNPIEKAGTWLSFHYSLSWIRFRNYTLLKRDRMEKECYKKSVQGLHDAWDYLKTDAYHSLPEIVKKIPDYEE